MFEELQKCMARFRPEIKLILGECDDMLERLGFCNYAPCIIYVDVTEQEMDALVDDLIQIEIDAYNLEGEPLPNDTCFLLYKEFGWMWDYFENAEWIDIKMQ